MLNWLGAEAARAAFAFLGLLGPVAASNLGGAVARAIGPRLGPSRVAEANLRRIMPGLDRAARRAIVRGVWDNLGRTVAELPHTAALRRTSAGPGWEIEGEEHLPALVAAGRPVVLFSAHIGNWELLPVVAARCGLPIASFYRAASNKRLDALIAGMRMRANGGLPMFAKGARGGRESLAWVAGGGSLGILIDQKQNDGVAATFFGRPAMTASAVGSIAVLRGCTVIGGHAVRLGPARFRIVVEPPLAWAPTGKRSHDVLAITQAVNDTVERWVRERPEQWLWLHRRWPNETAPGVMETSREPATPGVA